jgi:hypothetical protein
MGKCVRSAAKGKKLKVEFESRHPRPRLQRRFVIMSSEESQRTPGISRIDQPEKRTHGFFVRLRRKGKMFTGFFGDKSHGGRDQALEAAQVYYQKLVKKHEAATRKDWL